MATPSSKSQGGRVDPSVPARRPWVLLNVAITADGKIATANRAVSSFTSDRDREHMLELRATVDAVMAGARTVDLGPVTMNPGGPKYRRLRVRRGLAENNLRVVVSGSGSVDPEAALFRDRSAPVIVLTTRRVSPANLRRLRAVATEVKRFGDDQVDFVRALAWLKKKWHVRRLLCEGGGGVNDALFRHGLADELHLTIAPKIFGGRLAPTLADGLGVERLADAALFQVHTMRRHGDELFLVYRRATQSDRRKRTHNQPDMTNTSRR